MQVPVLSANLLCLPYRTEWRGGGRQDDVTHHFCGVRLFGLVLIPAPQTVSNYSALQNCSHVSCNEPRVHELVWYSDLKGHFKDIIAFPQFYRANSRRLVTQIVN